MLSRVVSSSANPSAWPLALEVLWKVAVASSGSAAHNPISSFVGFGYSMRHIRSPNTIIRQILPCAAAGVLGSFVLNASEFARNVLPASLLRLQRNASKVRHIFS